MRHVADAVTFRLSPLVQLIGSRDVLVLTGLSGRVSLFATRFSPVSAQDALSRPLGIWEGDAWNKGVMGLVGYDDLRTQTFTQSKFFRVEAALLFEHESRRVFALGDVDQATLGEVIGLLKSEPQNVECKGTKLTAEITDAEYLSLAAQAKNEILAGRYYQINLLRYFRTTSPVTLAWLLARLDQFGGGYSALIRFQGDMIASFSPERFIGREGRDCLATFPIKGTAVRDFLSEDKDRELAASLLRSKKDLAELHMIVDLMRNDLSRMSYPGSVKVEYPERLLTTNRVHHLEAKVTSKPKADLTLKDLFYALAPAGSITGAPKIEVMKAIATFEKRSRGFFMGNIFYHSDLGYFDSSVLIRTLYINNKGEGYYAAGSGLTIHSDPLLELQEIYDKCRVLTD